jgi:hypothetical protein
MSVGGLSVLDNRAIELVSGRGCADGNPARSLAARRLHLKDAVLIVVLMRKTAEQQLRHEVVSLCGVVVEAPKVLRDRHLLELDDHRAVFYGGCDVIESAHV